MLCPELTSPSKASLLHSLGVEEEDDDDLGPFCTAHNPAELFLKYQDEGDAREYYKPAYQGKQYIDQLGQSVDQYEHFPSLQDIVKVPATLVQDLQAMLQVYYK
ncbi:hypothetical protein NDU88_005746 [Pleurodeles waltl]|uniref:Uncharacterized protein n=1 Tax=Pleurodeles waltl TaxID=8319 RepID=A0AAV7WVK1_PLEWA|nr:hypothetical protein NDU88_005746 [Pleurodeles waltl]